MTLSPGELQSIAAQLETDGTPNEGPLPSRRKSRQFLTDLLQLLFPCLCSPENGVYHNTVIALSRLSLDLEAILRPLDKRIKLPVEEVVGRFIHEVPKLFSRMQGDAKAIFEGDPAAESISEVVVAYPGFSAIAIQRIAHEFYLMGIPVFPSVLTEYGHQVTGVDIHPGAQIGSNFFIDHATGIVIGETAEIGNNVKIYQGVTLGALSVDKGFSGKKRHPTIEDNVIIYSNATILGGSTVVGHDSIIGGNVWLTDSVPPWSKVYQHSEVKVKNSRPDSNQM